MFFPTIFIGPLIGPFVICKTTVLLVIPTTPISTTILFLQDLLQDLLKFVNYSVLTQSPFFRSLVQTRSRQILLVSWILELIYFKCTKQDLNRLNLLLGQQNFGSLNLILGQRQYVFPTNSIGPLEICKINNNPYVCRIYMWNIDRYR